jgi:rhomboid family GlyGly-CTERM serine protease
VNAGQTKGNLLDCKWTLALSAGIVLLNLGLLFPAVPQLHDLLRVLQFDGMAIRQGEFWRLVTGNLVHWSRAHLALDMSSLLVLGLLYERAFRRAYPWLLVVMALAVGVTGLLFWPQETLCRGLSGVDWGLFAAALCVELPRAWRSPWRWLWVGPAAAIFLVGLGYQEITGKFFAGALFLSEHALPAPWAHLAGAVSGAGFAVVLMLTGLSCAARLSAMSNKLKHA